MAIAAGELARYHRQLLLPEIGIAGQERLKAVRVLVIGAGGLGSPAALYLAAAGVGTLGVLDCDQVELSNLHRQVLFDTAAVARPKVAAARDRLASLNPEIVVVAHAVELRAANVRELFHQYDVIVDGTDRPSTRYLINDACVILGKPLVAAAIHRFEGHAMTYVPGRGPCYRCLFPQAPDGLVANCAQAGVLGVLPGVLGAIQATEALKLIVGMGEPLVGRLLTFDALELHFDELSFERRPDCAVCGDRPTITEPVDLDGAFGGAMSRAVHRLAPPALRALLEAHPGGGGLLLIDVREPREFSVGHLDGAINISLAELAARLPAIPRGTRPVFICRSGARSLAACGVAMREGLTEPSHLEGGMLAWASEVDPTLVVATAD